MKKTIIILALILGGFIAMSYSQNLYTATYSTVIGDTVTVNGTNGGSDWFTNTGYKEIWVQVYNGAFWFTAKVDFPCENISKISAYVVGADSSIIVYGYLSGGKSIALPLDIPYPQVSSAVDWLKYTYPGFKWRLAPTTAIWVQFYGFKQYH